MSHVDDSRSAPQVREALGTSPFDLRAALVRRLLGGLRYGHLNIVMPNGVRISQAGREPGIEATVILHRWRALRRLATEGDVGFAEAWIDGDWTSPDLTSVIRVAARNADSLTRAIHGSPLFRIANRVRHALNANSKRGSRRNIVAHYDLGNDFYRLWLDPTMLYSSALWTDRTPDLEAAQRNKLNRIRDLLDMQGGENVLEIGCGWGELAATLAHTRNARVTGLTLSPSQLKWASTIVAARGVGDNVELRLQDYRDVQGQFDRIVSIEMFEAVGEAYWSAYFATLARCLKPGGRAVLQVISIAEDRFEAYRRDSDFIQKHVFPGGFLPTKTALAKQTEMAGLTLAHCEFFGDSYAQTLADWRCRFHNVWPDIAAQGFEERFRRLWHYYLCYCEAGFTEGWIDVGLYTIEHPMLKD